jgi:hypothetical protein
MIIVACAEPPDLPILEAIHIVYLQCFNTAARSPSIVRRTAEGRRFPKLTKYDPNGPLTSGPLAFDL